ncbi:transporter substrate-binding domain-containing protein [Pectobacterium actinidiae]|uniref:transporter substrate-binding domain-containing protein n=1 Tax=Pectobacterium actinidiae TaxID=1507808 RepID=UPI00381097B0
MNAIIKVLILGLTTVLSLAQANEGSLKFAVIAEPYPPFSEKRPDGSWQGFEIDLIHHLCEEMMAKCEIVDTAWDGIIPALLAKKVDVIFSSMTVTDERSQHVLFSHPYYTTVPAVIGQPGLKFSLDKADMSGKIIGVQTSTTSANYLKQKFDGIAEIRYYDTQEAVNSDLLAGRIDFEVADDILLASFLKATGDSLQSYGIVPYDPILGGGIAAAFRPSDKILAERMNSAIDKMVVSDFFRKLSFKYFATNISPIKDEIDKN